MRKTLYCEGPVSITLWEYALYPQYAGYFRHARTIPYVAMVWLKMKAEEKLQTKDGASDVRAHWARLVSGTPPYGLEEESPKEESDE